MSITYNYLLIKEKFDNSSDYIYEDLFSYISSGSQVVIGTGIIHKDTHYKIVDVDTVFKEEGAGYNKRTKIKEINIYVDIP